MYTLRFLTVTLLITTSSSAMACDMDGMYGGRFSAFAVMAHKSLPAQSSDDEIQPEAAPDWTRRSTQRAPSQPLLNSQPQPSVAVQASADQLVVPGKGTNKAPPTPTPAPVSAEPVAAPSLRR